MGGPDMYRNMTGMMVGGEFGRLTTMNTVVVVVQGISVRIDVVYLIIVQVSIINSVD
jgi:hypothetical protein